ncbi:hypothetical protein [Flavobacterium sp. A45]|uniref:hypothetical protein n=1 Tax=Flavobacterium sp. A45 TaxID=1945862 RepID=UPI000F4F8CCC|nr:hypothetical protein [Flavobacterium sp. A45]
MKSNTKKIVENLGGKYGKKYCPQQPLQRILAFGLMGKWSCIWDDLANPNIGLNLIPNPL